MMTPGSSVRSIKHIMIIVTVTREFWSNTTVLYLITSSAWRWRPQAQDRGLEGLLVPTCGPHVVASGVDAQPGELDIPARDVRGVRNLLHRLVRAVALLPSNWN